MQTETKLSPMMVQWKACKEQAGEAVLLFRMGDFYEAFYEDAILLAKELEITLTKRQEIPMSGIPWHSSEGYIDKLVAKGFHVAIAEQVEDPKQSKGLVRRELTRMVTPGALIGSKLLNERSNNYFACITQLNQRFALTLIDLSTSEFRVTELANERELLNACFRFRPAEYLVPRKLKEKHQDLFNELKLCYAYVMNTEDEWRFDHQVTYPFLTEHFKLHNLDGFGLQGKTTAINSAGALLQYLKERLAQPIDHIRTLNYHPSDGFLALDHNSQRHLELLYSFKDGSRRNTLLERLDRTETPMGARLMVRWVAQPLIDVHAIQMRQDAVEELVSQPENLDTLQESLGGVRDLERLMMKISGGQATPRDLVALRYSLEPIPKIQTTLQGMESALLRAETGRLSQLPEVVNLIANALVDEPSIRLSDGKVIREGYHAELDELRHLSTHGKEWISRYQETIRQDTGIKTVKVGFNKAFGYYIEVSKGQAANMPESFERRQTLVNAERYITPELKEYESRILNAEEQISVIEQALFNQVRQEIAKHFIGVLENAAAIAQLDVLQSLAIVAKENGYVRPVIDERNGIEIIEGRHPVIETLHLGEQFVPNDTYLNADDQRLKVITGPNMAGKSTYMRQVALLVVMAQIGSFLPVKEARIGVVDKLFTRIGASDDLTRGQSTFMVEMTETANILNNATDRSLVILDEIGRGTSTYDGISIAYAVAEYLLNTPGKCPKTLFATHYFELTELPERHKGAVNYTVAVQECNDRVIFLRKIIRGAADKSYGIHVAGLAGLPSGVLSRAREILTHLEKVAEGGTLFEEGQVAKRKPRVFQEEQMMLFTPPAKDSRGERIAKEIKKIDLENMTPLQAQAKLAELKGLL